MGMQASLEWASLTHTLHSPYPILLVVPIGKWAYCFFFLIYVDVLLGAYFLVDVKRQLADG